MRKLYPALFVALSCTMLFLVSCDLLCPPQKIPPLPPAMIAR